MERIQHTLFAFTACWLILLYCSCGQSQTASNSSTTGWTRDATAHFVLFAQSGVRSKDSLPAIGQKLERIQSDLLRLLNEKDAQSLQIYFLKDRETLTSYTGFPANGYTKTKEGIIYFVDKAPFHLAFRHEMMHALSWRLWGPPRGYWLSEGIAVFASGNCGGYPLHALAQLIHKEGKLVPFERLTDTFDFKALEPSLQAASMVKYIYDHYGTDTLKAVWKSGWKNVQQVIGISSDALHRKWLAYIMQAEFDLPVDWDGIHRSGCE